MGAMRKLVAALVLTAVALVGFAVEAASANEGSTPSTCLYERWNDPDVCPGGWVIGIAQECRDTWRYNPAYARLDPVCRPYAPKPRFKPSRSKAHKVVKGQTLWRLAVIYYGNGHQWTKIAEANGIKGTKIRAGQTLMVPLARK